MFDRYKLHIQGRVVGQLKVDRHVRFDKCTPSQGPGPYVSDDQLPAYRAHGVRTSDSVCHLMGCWTLFVTREVAKSSRTNRRDGTFPVGNAED